MVTIPAKAHTSADGTLSIAVPTGMPDADVDVIVVVEAALPAPGRFPLQDWPEGYSALFGSLRDVNLERPPQGDLQDRLPLE